jgi:hypothetical protein
VALGIDAVEFDLRVSRDGALVVIHDETLDRTTDGSGPVALRSVTELEGLDAGARFTADGGRSFPWRGRGVRLSTFDEIIESLPRELPCIVELKTALRPSLCGSPFAVTQSRTDHRRWIRSRRDAPAPRRRIRARCVHARCRPSRASRALATMPRSPALSGALHSAALARRSGTQPPWRLRCAAP